MSRSEWMDQLVYDLIEYYEAEVLPTGLLYLELSMYGFGVLVVEEKVKHKRMEVCYLLYDAQGHPVPEPLVAFYIDEGGNWLPYEIRRHTGGHQVYEVLEDAQGAYVTTDTAAQEQLATFADAWAEVLRAQGWVGGAEKAITQWQEWTEEEDVPFGAPPLTELWDWVDEYGQCTATDGCWCPPDGTCEHGHPSWLVALGLI
jgi:hypothetical protein